MQSARILSYVSSCECECYLQYFWPHLKKNTENVTENLIKILNILSKIPFYKNNERHYKILKIAFTKLKVFVLDARVWYTNNTCTYIIILLYISHIKFNQCQIGLHVLFLVGVGICCISVYHCVKGCHSNEEMWFNMTRIFSYLKPYN